MAIYEKKEDDLTKYLTIRGYPMTDSAKIIAALVIRLGGEVHLTDVEYREAQGLCIWKNPEGGMTLEANTAASLGFDVLNDSTIE